MALIRKALFLDIDGVLNIAKTVDIQPVKVDDPTGLPFRQWGYPVFDPDCVTRLNLITDTTGAIIVISSTWRICSKDGFWRICQHLVNSGVSGQILGRTVPESRPNRGMEIQEFLDLIPVDKFVIIDDDDDMEHLSPFLVKTSWEEGIEPHHVVEAIDLLM